MDCFVSKGESMGSMALLGFETGPMILGCIYYQMLPEKTRLPFIYWLKVDSLESE